MEDLKTLIETLRTSAYTTLALLMPGALLLECLRRAADIGVLLPWTQPVPYLAAAYVAGFTLQGLSSRVFKWAWVQRLAADAHLRSELDAATVSARALITKRYAIDDVPVGSVIDIALTKAADKREIYDRFTAIRDMSRGLSVVFSLMIVAAPLRLAISWRGGDHILLRSCLVGIVVGLMGTWGSLDRYRRLQYAGEKAMMGIFLATELQERPKPNDVPETRKQV